MTQDMLFETAWKSLLCAGLVLLALRLLRRRSAAERSLLAHLGLAAIVMLPLAASALPRLDFEAPRPVASAYRSVAPIVASEPEAETMAPAATAPDAASAPDWQRMMLALWAIPAAALLLLTLVGIARLRRLRARAEVVVDPSWLTALASAQHRLGFKHGTALLVSSELKSPISWGIVRPVILLDARAVREPERAEAIIAHELAHVARLDWPALLLGRLAVALFWFNPLVWLLARHGHDLSEQAADDVVLRSDVSGPDYAEVLVGAARHATPPLLLAANGVAPSRSSLGRRVIAVLDPARNRVPVRLLWVLVSLAGTGAVATGLAAANPHLPMHKMMMGGQQAGYGETAAARLAAIPTPQTQAIARAIRAQDWDLRRVEGATRFAATEATAPLLLALRDPSATTRKIAIWGLSELRPPGAIAPIAALLDDSSAGVRGQAARALGDLGATGETLAIARLLEDPDSGVRIDAAHALGDLMDPAARPALEAARDDPDRTVRNKAKWALRQIAEAQAMTERRSGG
jgi:beta-lactamase regulating signal transducer with metallopeptidase domain